MFLESQTTSEVVLLDFNFNQTNKTTHDNLTPRNNHLITLDNNNYLISKNTNGLLSVKILSIRGDLVFNLTLPYNVNKILKITNINNNILIAYLTLENNLMILNLNNLTQNLSEKLIPFSVNGTVFEIENSFDQNITIFGKMSNNTSLIKNNFGGNDIFIFKLFNGQ